MHEWTDRPRLEAFDAATGIDPAAVEAHYGRCALVREICVLACVTAGHRRLHGIVVPDLAEIRTRRLVNVRDWIRFELETLSATLPASHRLSGFDLHPAPLARTPSGEIDRRLVASALAAGIEAAAAGPLLTGASSDVARRVMEIVAARAPEPRPHGGAFLEFDLGFDSITRVELIVALEAELGRRPPADRLSQVLTLDDLIQAFDEAPLVTPTADARRGVADPWAYLLEQPVDAGRESEAAELRRPKPLRLALFHGVLRLARLASRVCLDLDVEGLHHLPSSGACLLCANHQSFLDGFLLSAALPYRVIRRVFFLGASEYYTTPLMRRAVGSINMIRINPDADLVGALRIAAEGLRLGKALVLFPEGERTIDGTLKRFRLGGPILAAHLDVPMVPVALDGAFEVWPRGRGIDWSTLRPFGRHRIRIRIGRPLWPGRDGVPRQPAALAGRLREEVARLGRFDETPSPQWTGALDPPRRCR